MNVKVLLVGTDLNTYYMVRTCNELFNVKIDIIGKEPMRFTKYSNLINFHYNKDILDKEKFKDILIDYAKQKNYKDKILLIPCHDLYVELIVDNKEFLEKYYIFNLPRNEIVKDLLNKKDFYTKYGDKYIDIPATFYYDPVTMPMIPKELVYPIVIKPSNATEYNKHPFLGQAKVYRADNQKEAFEILHKISCSGYKDIVVLQDYIPGDDTCLFDIDFYSNKEGKVVYTTFARVGLQESKPTTIGCCTVLINGYNAYDGKEEVLKKLIDFLEEIGYTGFGEIDLKYDIRDNRYKVLEINPRQARSAYYVTALGYNMVEILINDLIENVKQEYKHIDDEILMSMVSKYIINKYIKNTEFKKRAMFLLAKKRNIDPLVNKKDANLKFRWYLFLRRFNYIKKYKKYKDYKY